MTMGSIVLASCLTLAPYYLDFDLVRYTELVECYRQGEYLESARALSKRPLEKIREFANEFRASPRSDIDLQAAALLHMEVIRWFKSEELARFEMARLHIESITDDQRRAAFEKKSRLALGYLFYSRLRLEEAEALFRGGGSSEPAERFRAEALSRTGRLWLLRDRTPADWDVRYALGTLQEAMILTTSDQRSLEEAELLYRQMLEESPGQAPLHIRLGHILWRRGQVEESLAEIESYLPKLSDAEAPARLVAHLVLGEIYENRGETEKALAHYRSAHAVDAKSQAASAALGLALAAAGRDSEAAAVTAAFLESGGHESVTDDTWWQYVLGRAVDANELFAELQKEVRH